MRQSEDQARGEITREVNEAREMKLRGDRNANARARRAEGIEQESHHQKKEANAERKREGDPRRRNGTRSVSKKREKTAEGERATEGA